MRQFGINFIGLQCLLLTTYRIESCNSNPPRNAGLCLPCSLILLERIMYLEQPKVYIAVFNWKFASSACPLSLRVSLARQVVIQPHPAKDRKTPNLCSDRKQIAIVTPPHSLVNSTKTLPAKLEVVGSVTDLTAVPILVERAPLAPL